MKGKLYIVPTFLSDADSNTILEGNKTVVNTLTCFIVEDVKTARRHLRAMGYKKNFDEEVTFFEWDKHKGNPIHSWLEKCEQGFDVGLMSECGTPCIADPGNLIVKEAHRKNIQVVPMVGANSILLALMASGFSGQQFSFHGYLPIQSADRIKKLRQLEELAKRTGFTQLFMETPFRNESMLRDVVIALQPSTLFHVSCDLTLATEFTATKKIEDWKKEKHTFQKRYCIYAIGV